MSWRVLLGITLLGAFIAAIAFLDQGAVERGDAGYGVPVNGERMPPAAMTVDATTCQECHPEIYAQWASSQHHHAYLNPDVRDAWGMIGGNVWAGPRGAIARQRPGSPARGAGLPADPQQEVSGRRDM